jgi:hypothetical protein
MQETYQDLEIGTKLELYHWVFRYNSYTKTYIATTRDYYQLLWDNIFHENVIQSSSMATLEEIIISNSGELEKVKIWKNKFGK